MSTFGEILRTLRKERKISSDQLGEALGVSGEAVRMWERGTRSPRKMAQMALCDYFGVSMDYLNGRSIYKNEDEHAYFEMMEEELALDEVRDREMYGDEYIMVTKYRKLTHPHKQSVNEMVDLYYEKDKDK